VGGGVDGLEVGCAVELELDGGEDKTSTVKFLTSFDNVAELSVGDAANGTELPGEGEGVK